MKTFTKVTWINSAVLLASLVTAGGFTGVSSRPARAADLETPVVLAEVTASKLGTTRSPGDYGVRILRDGTVTFFQEFGAPAREVIAFLSPSRLKAVVQLVDALQPSEMGDLGLLQTCPELPARRYVALRSDATPIPLAHVRNCRRFELPQCGVGDLTALLDGFMSLGTFQAEDFPPFM